MSTDTPAMFEDSKQFEGAAPMFSPFGSRSASATASRPATAGRNSRPQTSDKLNRSMDDMRANTMVFSNAGVDMTLEIPDSRDVKKTFSQFATTIVDQDADIGHLTEYIEEMNGLHQQEIKRIEERSLEKFKTLQTQNKKLEGTLKVALTKIKNFSYNMQGYLDDGEDDDDKEIIREASFTRGPEIMPIAETAASATVENVPLDAVMDVEVGGPKVPPKMYKKGSEEFQKNLEYYNSIPPNVLPKEPKGRWQWTVRKVMRHNRMKREHVGLTRARVDKGFSFIDRLERLESELMECFNEVKLLAHKTDSRFETERALRLQKEEEERLRRLQQEDKDADEKAERKRNLQDQLDRLKADGDEKWALEEEKRVQRAAEAAEARANAAADAAEKATEGMRKLAQEESARGQALEDERGEAMPEQKQIESAEAAEFAAKEAASVAEVEEGEAAVEAAADATVEAAADAAVELETAAATPVIDDNDISKSNTQGKTDKEIEDLEGDMRARINKQLSHAREAPIRSEEEILMARDAIDADIGSLKSRLEQLRVRQVEMLVDVQEMGSNIKEWVIESMRLQALSDSELHQETANLFSLQQTVDNAQSRLQTMDNMGYVLIDVLRTIMLENKSLEEKHDLISPMLNDPLHQQFEEFGKTCESQMHALHALNSEIFEVKETFSSHRAILNKNTDILKTMLNSKLALSALYEKYDTLSKDLQQAHKQIEGLQDTASRNHLVSRHASSSDMRMGTMNMDQIQHTVDNCLADRDWGLELAPSVKGLFDTYVGSHAEEFARLKAMLDKAKSEVESKKITRQSSGNMHMRPSLMSYVQGGPRDSASPSPPPTTDLPLTRADSFSDVATLVPDEPALTTDPMAPPMQKIQRMMSEKSPETMSGRKNSFNGKLPAEDMYKNAEGMAKHVVSIGEEARSSGRRSQSPRGMLNRRKSSISSNLGGHTGRPRLNSVTGMLQDSFSELQAKVDKLTKDKSENEKAMELLSVKANIDDLHRKADMDLVVAMQQTIDELNGTIDEMRLAHKQQILKVKKTIEENLVKAVGKMMSERENDNKFSSVTTKALCLNCGRSAYARSEPTAHVTAPELHPSLNATWSEGPDVMHAGFRMPTPLHSASSPYLLPGAGGDLTRQISFDLFADPEADGDSPNGRRSFGSQKSGARKSGENLQTPDVNSPPPQLQTPGLSLHSPVKGLAALPPVSTQLQGLQPALPFRPLTGKSLKTVRHMSGNEEGKQIRPIVRKGLPSRHSIRAHTAYATDTMNDLGLTGMQAASRPGTSMTRPGTSMGMAVQISSPPKMA